MDRSILFLGMLLGLVACLEVEEKPASKASPLPSQSYESSIIRWNNDLVSKSLLDLQVSSDFTENEKATILDSMKTWNTSHQYLSFINETFSSTPNLDTTNLSNYRDNVLGIYKSYNWFDELSSFALGVTQFYATRRNAGLPSEYLEITHADIIINYRDFIFDPDNNHFTGYDFHSVVLHEMGHFLGLKHTRHVDDVMSPYLDTGEEKTSLSSNDKNLLNQLYTKTSFSKLMKKAVPGPAYTPSPNDEVIRGIIELMPCGCQKIRYEAIKKANQ